ncbi:MAG: hypothetical protein RIC35_14440 [Marinoscillum sp.]
MLKNHEIVLITSNAKDAQLFINALKRTEINNELIWIKDTDRAFDYLTSQGLYSGKTLTRCNKVFILDETFPEAESVRGLIRSNERLKDCQVLNLSEGREMIGSDKKPSDNQAFDFLGILNSLTLALL